MEKVYEEGISKGPKSPLLHIQKRVTGLVKRLNEAILKNLHLQRQKSLYAPEKCHKIKV